ncbi:MAG: phosphate-starvation-inducible PsiE family protein [Proteobacteria bacterium]|nr:phosphate-starvation-inducible PsiE family protein [Pseudomonadota bacterium]
MNSFEQIKSHYGFTNGDIRNLEQLRPVMEKYASEFVAEFYQFVKNLSEHDKYLKDDTIIRRHQDALRVWFLRLFKGDYDRRYFDELERVGMAHVKINLPAHYVNAAMHFVKGFIHTTIHKEFKDLEECVYFERSADKILDINLDIFTSSYIEEEKKFFLSQRLESYLIQFANRFTYGLNLTLVGGLVMMGLGVMWLFTYDLMHLLDGNIEQGLLRTLGSLLMLWVVIELMETEVKHLKGGKFKVKVFISVALVAVIRKILVTSLKTDAVEAQLSLVAAVAVLGVVYWLIAKVEG